MQRRAAFAHRAADAHRAAYAHRATPVHHAAPVRHRAADLITGQNSTTQPSLHLDLVAGSPDETLQLVATQCTHSQAPALLCPECTTTRDARAARNPNPESSR